MNLTTRKAFRRLPVGLLAGLLALLACVRVDAAPTSASEAAVKAAYLFNIVKFTEWPASMPAADSGSLVICTDAEDELRDALDSLSGKTVRERSVVVRAIDAGGLTGCDVALLDTATGADLLGGERPVLTVTTREHADAMVRLFIDGRKLRFAVNLAAARRASIQFSAKLLGVAAEVSE